MKIVIVGAGISGCSIYLALKKHLPQPPAPADNHSYTIYEAYDTGRNTTFRERPFEGATRSATLVVGGGLGVGPNGLEVLKRLDESLLRNVVRSGYPYSKFQIKNSYGWDLLESEATAEVDGRQMNSVAMSRRSIWQCLRDRVPDEVIVNKKIDKFIPNGGSNGRHLIVFADGSDSVETDLVIGTDEEDPYPPKYEDLVGVGGFAPVTETMLRDIPKGSMTITFGRNGFFGYVYSSSSADDEHCESPYHLSTPGDTLTWWSTYGMNEYPDPKSVDCDAITEDLRKRHGNWKDPVIQEIIQSVQVQTIWPMWTTPELPIWDRDGIILLGDAAHALPPTSGQGSAQALEDTECFTLLLTHYLNRAYGYSNADSSEKDAIQLAAKKHRDLRYPRVEALLDEARQRSKSKQDMNILMELVMYFFLWVLGKIGPKGPAKAVLEYNIAEEVQKVITAEIYEQE